MAAGQGRAGPGTRAGGRPGLTKGYSQDHTDFYVPNGRPKKLWLKELAPKACVLMCARELPVACQAAEGDGGGARSPLKVSQLQTLREAFGQVPDPRSAASRRHPLAALLGLVALGLLMGARDVLDSIMNLPRGEIVNRGALLREVETDIAALLEAVNELEAKGTRTSPPCSRRCRSQRHGC